MKPTKKEDLLDQIAPPALWRASDFHPWREGHEHDTASRTIDSAHHLSGLWRLRLTIIEPAPDGDGDRLSFNCQCGFEYTLSERAQKGR